MPSWVVGPNPKDGATEEDIGQGIPLIEAMAGPVQMIEDLLEWRESRLGKSELDSPAGRTRCRGTCRIGNVFARQPTQELSTDLSLRQRNGIVMGVRIGAADLWNLCECVEVQPRTAGSMSGQATIHVAIDVNDTGQGPRTEVLGPVCDRFRQGDPPRRPPLREVGFGFYHQ